MVHESKHGERRHPILRPSSEQRQFALACCCCSRGSKLLPGGDGRCWPISFAILLQDGLHDVELLRSSLSSSVRPAIASVKNSARANTTVSTAAAAQAARRGRAGSAHHLLQPCSLHALPASRRAAIDAKKPLNFPAVFACFGSGWAKVSSSSFFEAATPKQIMKMQACATAPLERLSPTPLHYPLVVYIRGTDGYVSFHGGTLRRSPR